MFVDQVKQEEINAYNDRHRDYLIRAGKLQPQNQHKNIRLNAQMGRREMPKEKTQENIKPIRSTNQATPFVDQRPLKGSNNYIIPQDDIVPQQNKNTQRAIKQIQREQTKIPAKIIEQPPLEKPIQSLTPKEQLKIAKISNVSNEPPAQFEEVVLVQCPEGCGKKFNERALEKHVKICGKAEVKRKVFQTKVVDDEALQLKKEEKQPKKQGKEIPKWKMESNRFRNAINQQKALQNGGPPPPALPQLDERVECPGCGRKFNAEPAAKHIPNCVKRNGKK